MISLKDATRHPLTAATVFVTSLAQVIQIPVLDAILGVVWSQLSVLFTGASIFAFTVLPNVQAPTALTSNVQTVAVLLAVVYGLKLLTQFGSKVTDQLNDETR